MSDPFEALRTPVVPAAPDPAFVARLRARVERALVHMEATEGADMSDAIVDDAPARRGGDIAYVSLWVADVERAADFYASVLGWPYGEVSSGPSRQVAGATPHHGLWGGQERSTLFLCFAVDEMDAALERVRAAGGSTEAPARQDYGLVAMCRDDQGAPFSLYEAPPGDPGVRGPANGARHGDVSYITMEVRDSGRARAFYGAVLGWQFAPGRVTDGWRVEDVVPMTGMHGGHDMATVVPMYRVDDVAAAVERVRAAGGTSTDPERRPYGVTAECTDDQGTRFYLGEA